MSLQAGQIISHYRIVEKIGEGGMGEVYLAEDTDLERRVALKLLPASVTADRDKLERFQREAKVVASLNHPNIVTIHSVEQAGEARFLTMELVEGTNLGEQIPDVGLRLSRVFAIAIDLSDALAVAHEKGVVHRDLKPANIMITNGGQLKVLDFGLAKLVSEVAGPAGKGREQSQTATRIPSLTGEGMVLGTVPYMSPEQIAGEAVDHRSDIFSLGVVLYELATGRRPFLGNNSAELISSIMRDTPPLVTEIKQDLPRHLARIIGRCLDKEARNRYQSALDIGNDLRGLRQEIDSGDVMATNHIGPAPAHEPTRARWRTWGAISAVAVLVMVGALWLVKWAGAPSTGGSGPGEISVVAVLPFVNTDSDPETEYLSDGITESLINSLAELPGLRVVSRNSSFRYKGRQVDLADVAAELGVHAVVTGRAAQRGETLVVSAELVAVESDSQLWGSQYSRSVSDIFVVQEDIALAIAEHLRRRLSNEQEEKLTQRHTENTEAYQLYLRGRYRWNRRTQGDMKQALDHFKQAIALDSGFALAWAGVADCYATSNGAYLGMDSSEAHSKAKAAAIKALELDATLAEAHITLGDSLYIGDWDWVGAEREFLLGLDLKPDYAKGHQWYGGFLSAMGRHEEAIAEKKKAYELDPLSIIMPVSIGDAYARARNFDEAITWFEKVLAQSPELKIHFLTFGFCYLAKGDEQRAVQKWQEWYSWREKEALADRLGEAYARDGMNGVWRFWLDRSDEEPTSMLESFSSAQLGEHDRAFRSLELALDQKQAWVIFLQGFAPLDPLHSDPRFTEILQRLNLPEGVQQNH